MVIYTSLMGVQVKWRHLTADSLIANRTVPLRTLLVTLYKNYVGLNLNGVFLFSWNIIVASSSKHLLPKHILKWSIIDITHPVTRHTHKVWELVAYVHQPMIT